MSGKNTKAQARPATAPEAEGPDNVVGMGARGASPAPAGDEARAAPATSGLAARIGAELSVPKPPAADQMTKGYRRRRFWTWFSLVPMVLVPFLVSVYYFGWVAADRYAVETKFAIRSPSGAASSDLLGMVTGVTSSGSVVLDGYILLDYIESREMVRALQERVDLRAIYDTDLADPVTRLRPGATTEAMTRYFGWMHDAYFDSASQVMTVEVQAFTPEDAETVSRSVLALCEELVNRISRQAREDMVSLATAEVERAETRLRDSRAELGRVRDTAQIIDPTASVGAQQTLLGDLEAQLSAANSDLASALEFFSADAPQVKLRLSRIAALNDQISEQRQKLGTGSTDPGAEEGSLSEQVGTFEELAAQIDFRQRAYVSALASLEAARLEADRQQRYVATFVEPMLPEEPARPRRLLGMFGVLLAAFTAWAISVMMVYIIREHAI